jgi:hypothetical protein
MYMREGIEFSTQSKLIVLITTNCPWRCYLHQRDRPVLGEIKQEHVPNEVYHACWDP